MNTHMNAINTTRVQGLEGKETMPLGVKVTLNAILLLESMSQ